ncbi:MAG: purine-nucleoside phosphorylase [Planctomycetes bacterium]|nr:purine-nucleoside phosphorylase [Planctomycetota bacterium]
MTPVSLRLRVEAAAAAVRARSRTSPRFGITLGTGLGGLTREIEVEARIPYKEIPGFPEPRVTSHDGTLVLGTLAGQPVAALEGRYHFYEGYSLEDITLPVRVLKALGVETAVFSNAAGGLNPAYRAGDIMVISDHLNLMGVNPLVGPNDEALGPRFPDMCEPYHLGLAAGLEAIALEHRIRAHRGVYAALTGPCLETRAEYRFLRTAGADAVGMSTVPEVIVAVHAGLRVAGISCITDVCIPDALKPAVIEEILRVAGETEPKMTLLVRKLIERHATFL